ncbi:hypothetical protein ONZ45_g6674 [Pleurotus djamor]|nr:hypothetical protein ONZ45_g6674 [Pleurotus djamor]
MLHVQDKRLLLPDARTLAYADNGNTSSTTIVLYLHGEFNIGDASLPSPLILRNNFHFVAPSLPGWGHTSPPPTPQTYADTLIADVSSLISHLHPKTPISALTLYIYAHSFGTIPAQILYGAPHNKFPLGAQIAGVLLLAPFSPPHAHADYAKSLSWYPYLVAGPPARYIPYSLLTRVLSIPIAHNLKSEENAQRYIRASLLPYIQQHNHDLLDKWLDDRAIDENKLVRNLAHTMATSVSQSWSAFIDLPKIFHSGWGEYHPALLHDDDHNAPNKRVFIIAAQDDSIAPIQMAQWLANNLPNVTLKTVQGGHMAPFFHSDDAWDVLLNQHSSPPLP